MESDITGDGVRSAVAYGSGKGVRRRGGKKGRREISGSVTGRGKGGSERSATGEVGDEEDDDDDAGEGLMDDGEEMDKAAERKNLSVLVDAFTPEQTERYEMFRRVKLRKETVRKVGYSLLTVSTGVPEELTLRTTDRQLHPCAVGPASGHHNHQWLYEDICWYAHRKSKRGAATVGGA